MTMELALKPHGPRLTGDDARTRLLARMPVTERRLQVAGVSTAVLHGGDGPPVVLLHGPGELAAGWMRVIHDLATAIAHRGSRERPLRTALARDREHRQRPVVEAPEAFLAALRAALRPS